MLFVSLSRAELIHDKAVASFPLELRLDLFPTFDLEEIKSSLKNATQPILLTLRKASHGGKFQGNEQEREALIKELLRQEPAFFDLEYDMRPDFLHEVLQTHPKTQFILSYHNFDHIPDDLEKIYAQMSLYPAFTYKIAVMTHTTPDALRMLLFARKSPKVSVICMGEAGQFARVLGPVVGNRINYATIVSQEPTGQGQLSIQELMEMYHYDTLNPRTAIYGLIGDPILHSPGHIHQNCVFRRNNLNAVYVKMTVRKEELSDFIPLAKELGIVGLSVTIPLKELIVPFIDEISESAKEMGAINTLLLRQGKILGINTDGPGALDAIEKKIPVRGKKVVIIGAGGAARGIAFEAKARGADVVILNRTIARAQEIAAQLQCQAGGVDEVPENYDILINCSPDPMPIHPDKIRSATVAMDVVYFPKETIFLKEAALKKCQIVYGEEMFLNQAEKQTALWLRSS